MHNLILLEQCLHGFVAKMDALITNNGSRYSKPTKYVRSHKIHNNRSIISPDGFGFYLLWNI